jgi:uncharacterized protein (TIGR03067 family)
VRRGKIVGRDGGPTRYHSLAFSSDGKTLAAAVTLGSGKSADRIVLFDTETMEADGNLFPPGPSPARTIAFSRDGKLLVAACGIDRDKLKPNMTPDEMKDAGAVVVWERPSANPPGSNLPRPGNAALQNFQGTWKISGFDLGGDNALSDDEIKALGWSITISGNRFQFVDKNGRKTSSGRIAVDDSTTPPTLVRIETDRDQDVYTWCLYELSGDTLRLCQDVRGKGRPKEFKAGPDTTIASYKRVKE